MQLRRRKKRRTASPQLLILAAALLALAETDSQNEFIPGLVRTLTVKAR